MRLFFKALPSIVFVPGMLLLSACSGGGSDSKVGSGGPSGEGASGAVVSGPDVNFGGSNGVGNSGGSNGSPGPYMLPEGFAEADKGGWLLGPPLSEATPGDFGGGDAGTEDCGAEILGVVRDFKRGDTGGHPDFETFLGQGEKGIVQDALGGDQKPVYVAGNHQFTTTQANFDQWYRNVDGTNMPYLVTFSFEPNGGVNTFQSSAFYPLDGQGFGNEGSEPDHNFHFTTEVHTQFAYNGGETFTFTGDDDLWVYINNKLALDLGGLHSEQTDTVDLDMAADTLGITPGNTYALDLFHAERHTDQSNFRVDTNLQFTACQIIIDVIR
jgi:fibro-slime domain-containing protein